MKTPRHLRKLKAKMVLKDLSLEYVAEKAGINYSTASSILRGRLLDPVKLALLADTIDTAVETSGEAV